MEETKRFYPANSFRICIDEHTGSDISGRIYTPLSEEPVEFVSIGDVLLKMDMLFDKAGYPQGFQEKRSFDKINKRTNAYRGVPKFAEHTSQIVEQEGLKGTYDIIVKSRKNTSWQGAVYGIDKEKYGEFNGEVDLLATLMGLNL